MLVHCMVLAVALEGDAFNMWTASPPPMWSRPTVLFIVQAQNCLLSCSISLVAFV